MEKQIGKFYSKNNGEMIIVCTGFGISERTISGTVIYNTNPSNVFNVGVHSDSWTFHEDYLTEYEGDIILNNNTWREFIELGTSNI